jgi:hypothetical protein
MSWAADVRFPASRYFLSSYTDSWGTSSLLFIGYWAQLQYSWWCCILLLNTISWCGALLSTGPTLHIWDFRFSRLWMLRLDCSGTWSCVICRTEFKAEMPGVWQWGLHKAGIQSIICGIWGFHGGDDEECRLLRCGVVWCKHSLLP